MTKEQILEVLEMVKKNHTNKEIAAHFGVHPDTIVRNIRKLKASGYEVPARKRGRREVKL